MRLIISLLLFFNTDPAIFHLKTDLKKDKIILSTRHGMHADIKKSEWLAFERYAKMDLSQFKFSNKQIGIHNINKWAGGSKAIVIYEVETKIHVEEDYFEVMYEDLVVVNKKPILKDGPPLHIKADFFFHTYIIQSHNGPRFIYQSETKEGICHFQIGDKDYLILKEDIPIAFNCPDIKEILKIIS